MLKNTLLTSEASILSVVGVLVFLINPKLVGKIITPSQRKEKEIGADIIFSKDMDIYLIQLKLKKNENPMNHNDLEKQVILMGNYAKKNLDVANLIPMVIFGGINQERMKLAFFKCVDYANDSTTSFPSEIKEYSDADIFSITNSENLDIFKQHIYSKYVDLEIVPIIPGGGSGDGNMNNSEDDNWLDSVMIFTRDNDNVYLINSEDLHNLDLKTMTLNNPMSGIKNIKKDKPSNLKSIGL